MDLRYFEQLLRVVFSTFGGQKKILIFFKNIVIMNFNLGCNTERGSIDSLSIALGSGLAVHVSFCKL